MNGTSQFTAFRQSAGSRSAWAMAMLAGAVLLLCERVAGAGGGGQHDILRRAGQSLVRQQDADTGLMRSFQMPYNTEAYTYDQAIGIKALLLLKRLREARRCADAMLALRDAPYAPWGADKPKGWADSYDSSNGGVTAKAIAAGPNAWMGMALIDLHRTSKDRRYRMAAEEVARMLLALRRFPRGHVGGGHDENGRLFMWSSTEHNADTLAFFAQLAHVTGNAAYRQAAIDIARWLDAEMWDDGERRYHVGYIEDGIVNADYPEGLDSQTWTILAQIAAASLPGWPRPIARLTHNGLPWIDQYRQAVPFCRSLLLGYAKTTYGARARPSIWTEGTAGYVLAAKAVRHRPAATGWMTASLRALQRSDGSVPYSFGSTCPDAQAVFGIDDTVVDYFEGAPNCLYGTLGVYGDGEPNWAAIAAAGYAQPFSWFYGPETPGSDTGNVHSCWQSFRLVNATDMCMSQSQGWASLGINLGPNLPAGILPVDVSACSELVVLAKADAPAGTRISIGFRDALAPIPIPQYQTGTIEIGDEWTPVCVDLSTVTGVDLAKLVQISIEFGTATVENPAGTILYVDDIAFVRTDGSDLPAAMPKVFPQHWPYGSVAGTAWLVFMELGVNPFASKP